MTPEFRAVREYPAVGKDSQPLCEIRVHFAAVVAPGKGYYFGGTSGFVLFSEENPKTRQCSSQMCSNILLWIMRSAEERLYPGSLMGVIATIRQTILDANYYTLDHADYAKHPEKLGSGPNTILRSKHSIKWLAAK